MKNKKLYYVVTVVLFLLLILPGSNVQAAKGKMNRQQLTLKEGAASKLKP